VLAEPVEPLIGDNDAGLFGVNGGIGEVGRVTQRGLGDRLEERRLADIGKTNLDRSHGECGWCGWKMCEGRRKKEKEKEERAEGGLNSFSWN
jgi:hypothetical protein